MTSRSGLSVALVGLLMAGLCLATLFLISNMNDPGEAITMENLPIVGMAMGFVLLLDLGAILGLILIVVGLVFALKKQTAKSS